MGLFINKQEHPDVYKNSENLHEPNQFLSRQDFLSELMNEQQKANRALNRALSELKTRYQHQADAQDSQWKHVDHQLNDLKSSTIQQKKFENQIVTNLQAIHERNVRLETIVESETTIKQSIMAQVGQLSKTYEEIAGRLERSEDANHQLAQQMDEQLALQKEVAKKLNQQAELHGGMLERLDHQDALLDKFARQLNHIRSILFERTNYLASKIDDGYKLTSSYVYKLMTGSDQPLTFFLMNRKQEENNEHVE